NNITLNSASSITSNSAGNHTYNFTSTAGSIIVDGPITHAGNGSATIKLSSPLNDVIISNAITHSGAGNFNLTINAAGDIDFDDSSILLNNTSGNRTHNFTTDFGDIILNGPITYSGSGNSTTTMVALNGEIQLKDTISILPGTGSFNLDLTARDKIELASSSAINANGLGNSSYRFETTNGDILLNSPISNIGPGRLNLDFDAGNNLSLINNGNLSWNTASDLNLTASNDISIDRPITFNNSDRASLRLTSTFGDMTIADPILANGPGALDLKFNAAGELDFTSGSSIVTNATQDSNYSFTTNQFTNGNITLNGPITNNGAGALNITVDSARELNLKNDIINNGNNPSTYNF
ncbi:MAG: hypothetical protein HC796_01245, partial [Synechococcaceae cyanobacterium RL_1_2]|nr:hypothetical protein [Synechococcaceae cyanobacterium RL_1_2]